MCNRFLYRKSVLIFYENKYNITPVYFNRICSYDGFHYNCKTCDRKLKKKEKIPYQAVCNSLELFGFSEGFPSLKKIEKVVIMPKRQFCKIKGAVCNVPVEVGRMCNILPRGTDTNCLILMKLKRRLSYRGYVLIEPVRPDVAKLVLDYLKQHNFLYNNIVINIDNVSVDLLCLDEIPVVLEVYILETELEDENPLNQYRVSANEIVLIPTIPCETSEERITMFQGEGVIPISILTDTNCEELSHPHLFPT